ncbi:MAG: hypothetical protein H0T47_22685 [Planctomycetaceae bacterium]|nr:hypothetical protein [Planctomycetaceae bacterium]
MRTLAKLLLVHANAASVGDTITDDDVRLAWKRLEWPARTDLGLADAQGVVSQALHENRIIEWVSYGMAIVLFLCGLGLLCFGVVRDDKATRVGAFFAGTVIELLILIPFRFAINSRRHNIALRMMGVILHRIEDPKAMAPLLKETFLAVVLDRPNFKSGK